MAASVFEGWELTDTLQNGFEACSLSAVRKGSSVHRKLSSRCPDICSVQYLNIQIEVTTFHPLLFAPLTLVSVLHQLPPLQYLW